MEGAEAADADRAEARRVAQGGRAVVSDAHQADQVRRCPAGTRHPRDVYITCNARLVHAQLRSFTNKKYIQ